MLDLREYRTRRVLLADYLPWAGLVAPGIVLNKDGSLQRTCRYRGPDLDSATDAELVAVCARLNNALKRLGSGWAPSSSKRCVTRRPGIRKAASRTRSRSSSTASAARCLRPKARISRASAF
jgi:type IV secretory pathway VirB4 component